MLGNVAREIVSWKTSNSVISRVTHQLSLVHLEPAGDARQTLDQRQGGPLHPQALQDRTHETDAWIHVLFPRSPLMSQGLSCQLAR